MGLLGFIAILIIGVIIIIFGGERLGIIFLGITLILFGVRTIFEPKFYSYKFDQYIDFTGYNIPLGIFMIIVGALFIWTTFKKKSIS